MVSEMCLFVQIAQKFVEFNIWEIHLTVTESLKTIYNNPTLSKSVFGLRN